MLAILSPAKKLDFDPVPLKVKTSKPTLLKQSEILVERSRQLKSADLMKLMGISQGLASLNVGRFKKFETPFTADNAKAAIFAFRGDTYVGFDVDSLDDEGLKFAQDHVRILSGLYGVLRPLDLMQAYRLEMGIKLDNERGKNLYEFWGDRITKTLNKALADHDTPALVNLASKEYFSSVKLPELKGDLIDCVFKEVKGGKAKIVSFSAKKARGMMARFIVDERIEKPKDLKGFSSAGYVYQPKLSSPEVFEFHRVH